MNTDYNYVRSLTPEEYRRQRKIQDRSEVAAGGPPDEALIGAVQSFRPTTEQEREQRRAALEVRGA